MKVFLGGTCNESTWREKLIPMLKIDYFNPVVKDWKPENMKGEIEQREICDFVLYVITKEMIGAYSIAEVVDDSNKRPNKTIFCYLDEGFSVEQIKSLSQVRKMIESNGAKTFSSIKEIANYLNSFKKD